MASVLKTIFKGFLRLITPAPQGGAATSTSADHQTSETFSDERWTGANVGPEEAELRLGTVLGVTAVQFGCTRVFVRDNNGDPDEEYSAPNLLRALREGLPDELITPRTADRPALVIITEIKVSTGKCTGRDLYKANRQ